MKTTALLLLTSTLYASQWYTATSLSVGTKSIDHLSDGFEFKAEQYFINDAVPKLYYKAGYFHEQLKVWDSEIDTAENILVGIGYNVFDYKSFFVDLGLSGGYRFSYSTTENDKAYVEYNDPIIIPYGELGVGYSFGRISLRADLLMGLLGQGEAVIFDKTTSQPIGNEVENYDMLHLNFGVAYWW